MFPLFATRDLGGDDATFTILFSVVSVGRADRRAGRRPAAKRIDVRTVALAALGFGVALAAAWRSSRTMAAAYAVGVLVGLGSIAFLDGVDRDRADPAAEPEMRGRVLALQAMVFLGSHADRRPDRRRDRRAVRRPLRDRRRRGGGPRRRRVGSARPSPHPRLTPEAPTISGGRCRRRRWRSRRDRATLDDRAPERRTAVDTAVLDLELTVPASGP